MRNGKYTARRTSGTKAFTLMLALILVVGCVAGGTLAWLTAESKTVTNTFTAGDITITLEEHKLKDDGTLDNATKVTENKNYKVVPGATQPKDPFVTVNAKSEKCYVYVKVTNTMKVNGTVVATPDISATDWETVATSGDVTLYRYKGTKSTAGVVDASTAAVELQVFGNVSYDGTLITKANIAAVAGGKIEIQAYAHQSDNTTQTVADAAAKTWAGITA